MIQKTFDGTNQIGAGLASALFNISQAGVAVPITGLVLSQSFFLLPAWLRPGAGQYTLAIGSPLGTGVVGHFTQKSASVVPPVFAQLINSGVSTLALSTFNLAGAAIDLHTSASIWIEKLPSGKIGTSMPITVNQQNTQEAFYRFQAGLSLLAGAPVYNPAVPLYNSFNTVLPILANPGVGINTIQFPTFDFTQNLPIVLISARLNAGSQPIFCTWDTIGAIDTIEIHTFDKAGNLIDGQAVSVCIFALRLQ